MLSSNEPWLLLGLGANAQVSMYHSSCEGQRQGGSAHYSLEINVNDFEPLYAGGVVTSLVRPIGEVFTLEEIEKVCYCTYAPANASCCHILTFRVSKHIVL